MASGQLLVLFACLTLVAARTVNLEKFILSVTDDSKDIDPAESEILTSLLDNLDDTSNGIDYDLQGCSKGTCTFCKKKFVKACFIAKIEGDKILMEVTINGKAIFKAVISAPKKVCKKVGFIPGVKDICLAFTDIDLKNMSGCVSVEVKLKLGKTVKFKIGCFKIPRADAEMQASDDAGIQQETADEVSDILDPETVLKFLSLKVEN